MPHIFLLTSGLTGIRYASLQLAQRLRTEGYEVTYACPRPVGDEVRAHGVDYVQLPEVNYFPAPPVPEFNGPLRPLQRLWYKWRHRHARRQQAVDALGMTAFAQQLTEWQPDLCIIDVELHEHLMTAVAKSHPTVLLSQWYTLWERSGLPPLVSDTIPGQGAKGSPAAMRKAWRRLRRQRWWMFYKQYLRTAGTDRRSTLLAYAKRVGFPLNYVPDNYWPGPLTYADLPVLAMTHAEMEFPHEHRPHLHYLGAMVADDRPVPAKHQETLKTIEDQITTARANGQAVLCCTVSTFKAGDPYFLRRLVTAVSERPDWVLFIALGGKLDLTTLGQLPLNVHAYAWLPQLQVLAQADLSINHAGIHTINECIHFGVPMLVYSGKRSDQDGCAARVHYHQLGIMADKDVDTPEQMREKIATLLTDDRYALAVNQMQKEHHRYREDKVLEKTIRKYLTPQTVRK